MKQANLDLLAESFEHEGRFIQSLSPAERDAQGAPTDWGPKDLLAHILAWKVNMAERLEALRRGEDPPTMGDLDGINAQIFERYRGRPFERVRADWLKALEALVAEVKPLSEEQLQEREGAAWLEGRPLWRHVIGNGYTHPVTHLAQYAIARGRVEEGISLQRLCADRLDLLDSSPAWHGVNRYNLACSLALAGRRNDAIQELTEAFRHNPGLMDWSKQDTDLVSLHRDPDFLKLVEREKREA